MKKLISIALAVFMTLSLCTVTAFAEVTGDGSEDNPYLVSNYSEFSEAMSKATDTNNNIKLTADIERIPSYIEKSLVIDFNGYLVGAFSVNVLDVEGRLVFRNGVFDNVRAIRFSSCKDVVLENCKMNLMFMSMSNCNVRIQDCEIIGYDENGTLFCASSNLEINNSIIKNVNNIQPIYLQESTIIIDGVLYTEETLPPDFRLDGTYYRKAVNLNYTVNPTYSVTIPAEVTLGNTMDVKAENVVLEEGKQVVVRLTAASGENNAFTVSNGKTGVLEYDVLNGNEKVNIGDVVLSADPREGKTAVASLEFSSPKEIKYSGEYKGTVTFNVLVEEVQ